MANDLFVNLASLIPIAVRDLNASDKDPQHPLGQLAYARDSYGFRLFQYCRNMTGGATLAGELQKRVADATTSNITSGTTTSYTKTAAGYTVGAFKGRLLYIDDNDDSAGAAPEGESSPIVNNSATVVSVDPQRPFTVALAANDDVRIISFDHLSDAADGDLASKVIGVDVAKDGHADNEYGWWQKYGVCPDVLHKASSAVTSLNPVVADAAAVNAHGSDAVDLWVGYQLGTHAVDIVSNKSPVFLQLFGFVRPIA